MKAKLTFDTTEQPEDLQALKQAVLAPELANVIWQIEVNVRHKALEEDWTLEKFFREFDDLTEDINIDT